MEMIKKTDEEVVFVSEMDVSLANAIRKSVGEISILAIDECDIYKNDSVLYDEIIAHRLGLLSLKNQKMKKDESVEYKLKVKGKGERTEVFANVLGDDVVYPDSLLFILSDGQEIELVARARAGRGIDHAKFMPGLCYYKHLANIKISGEGEKRVELVELYPEVFEMYGEKVKVKNAWACDLDNEDMVDYPGVSISFDDNLVFVVESWGQIKASEIFLEACKSLKDNIQAVAKSLK